MVRVVIADDHAVVRKGIERILTNDPRIQVLAGVTDFSEAIAMARRFRPEVLILDVHMPLGPELSNSDLNVAFNSCGAKVLGISFANDDEARSLAASIGAAELLDKINLAKELVPAIMKIASAGNYLPRSGQAKPSDRSTL